MTQHKKILQAMLENPYRKSWSARDFQSGKYFVGYEATARMSELSGMYPEIFEVGRDGRFRTLSLKWEKESEIRKIFEEL